MRGAEKAIIKKDIRGVTANRQLFLPMLVVPLVFVVVLPLLFVLLSHFMPEDEEILQLLQQLGDAGDPSRRDTLLLQLVIDRLLPSLFLVIPIMTASVMAGGAFVGEKENRTLETLLYSPLSLRRIFRAKVMAAFGLGMGVAALSFLIMLAVLEISIFLTRGHAVWPGVSWLIILLMVSPPLCLIAITLIVRVSAKAQNAVEAQQSAVFLVLPGILLAAGQMTGLVMISPLLLLGVGAALAPIAWLLMRSATRRFTYERLLP